MRDEAKIQKGFISISILIAIIAFIAVASVATTGVVLHKQEKLLPLVASISQVFKVTKNTEPEVRLEEFQLAKEQLQLKETDAVETSLIEQELEQVKLEVEKAQAEKEKTQAELEKTQLEAERLKAEQEAKRLAEEQQEQEAKRLAEEQREKEELRIQKEEEQRMQKLQILAEEEKQRQLQQEIDALERERAERQIREDRALPVMEAMKEWIAESDKHLLFLEEKMEEAEDGSYSEAWKTYMLTLMNQYEETTKMMERLNTIGYKLDDYINYGTILPAEDRAFLSDLGIYF